MYIVNIYIITRLSNHALKKSLQTLDFVDR